MYLVSPKQQLAKNPPFIQHQTVIQGLTTGQPWHPKPTQGGPAQDDAAIFKSWLPWLSSACHSPIGKSTHVPGSLLPASNLLWIWESRDGTGRACQLALESSSAAFQHEAVLSLHFIRPIKAWHTVITWQINSHFV